MVKWTCILLLITCTQSIAQRNKQATDFYNLFYDPIEQKTILDEEIIDAINHFIEHPLKINNAEPEELIKFPFFTKRQAYLLFYNRSKQNGFTSIKEIAMLPGFNMKRLQLIAPLLDFSATHKTRKRVSINISSKWKRKLELPKGFFNGEYHGDANYYLLKLKIKNLKIIESIGIVSEKDPGEKWFGKIPDYNSAYALLKIPKLKNTRLIIGDYKLKTGLGLNVNNGFFFTSHYLPETFLNQSNSLIPHFSSSETDYMRGIAVKQSTKNYDVLSWYSRNKIDANLNNDLSISTILNNGYHRSSDEISKKAIVTEQNFGASINYNFGSTEIGGIVNQTVYSNPLKKNNYYTPIFEQKAFTTISILGSHVGKSSLIKVELAFQSKTAYSATTVCSFDLNNRTTLFSKTNLFSQSYYNPKGKSMGKSNFGNNEISQYTGLSHSFRNLQLLTFGWIYKPIWWTYQKHHILSETRLGTSLNYTYIQHKFSIQLEQRDWKQDSKENNSYSTNYKKAFIGKFNWNIQLATQAQLKGFLQANVSETKGLLISNRFVFSLKNLSTFHICFIQFHAPRWENRLYGFESDLPYEFNINTYYLQGKKIYLIYTQQLGPLKIKAKLSRTFYNKECMIGSSNELINTKYKTEAKLFLAYRI